MNPLAQPHARLTRRVALVLFGAAALRRPPTVLAEHDGT